MTNFLKQYNILSINTLNFIQSTPKEKNLIATRIREIAMTKLAIPLNCENELERLFEDTPFSLPF